MVHSARTVIFGVMLAILLVAGGGVAWAVPHLALTAQRHHAPPEHDLWLARPSPVGYGVVSRAQYGTPGLRGPGVRRRLPPALRSRRPPPRRQQEERGARPSIKPSEALRAARRQWPDSVALAVNLRGPVYVVKLRVARRVVQVIVDARTGRVKR